MKTLHIINTLEHGGAQSVLLQVLEGLVEEKNSHLIITLKEQKQLSPKFEALNIPIIYINPINLFQLIRVVNSFQPSLIQTWLYHSDFIGSLIKIFNWHLPLIWGIHHTTSHVNTLKFTTALIVWFLSWFSHFIPNQIICCSESAYQTHIKLGYAKRKMEIIHNGVDTKLFQPNNLANSFVKKELKIQKNIKLIGMFARYHPQKDFLSFVRAAKILVKKNENINFVLAGANVDSSNQELMDWIKNENIESYFHLLGNRDDMPLLVASMDVVTLTSSHGEALPQVLAEAMACGVPCVATNVGDISKIIGKTGLVVQPCDPELIAKAWGQLLNLSKPKYNVLGLQARKQIEETYNTSNMVLLYKKTYENVIKNTSH